MATAPRNAELVSPTRLRIEWRDGVVSELGARALRQACPCAQCVEEWSGRQILAPESVPASITIVGAETVGRYAMSFRWSDGHATGIFSWDYLRRLGDAARTGDEPQRD